MSVGFSSRKAAAAARCTSPSPRSEEHTSELQSQSNLVCRLLLEKKKKILRTAPELLVLRNDPGAQAVAFSRTRRHRADLAVDRHVSNQLLQSPQDRKSHTRLAQ